MEGSIKVGEGSNNPLDKTSPSSLLWTEFCIHRRPATANMLLSGAIELARCFVVISPLFLAIASGAPVAGPAPAPTVTISSGVVIGTTKTPVNHEPTATSFANVYLGVPFAQGPPERFSPPQPAEPWSTPVVAQASKPACIQLFHGPSNTTS